MVEDRDIAAFGGYDLDAALWNYRAMPDPWSEHLNGVVDGDTLDLLVDLGMHTQERLRIRLEGVDTAEVYGVEKESDEFEQGMRHSRYVESWIGDAVNDYDGNWPLFISTRQDETGKYGRLMATVVRRADASVLNGELIAEWPDVDRGYSEQSTTNGSDTE